MTDRSHESFGFLVRACAAVGLDSTGATPVRLAENALWRLPGGVIARITKEGQHQRSGRELRLARWLHDAGVPVVRPAPGREDVVTVSGRPVTFWTELPAHERGSVLDVATLLGQLHALASPGFALGHLDPFVRIGHRIDTSGTLPEADRRWLHGRLAELRTACQELPDGLPGCVVHGDAWTGNVARPLHGGTPVLMDLERCSLGRPEWDLVSTATAHLTTGTVSAREYDGFCAAYGTDVRQWSGADTMRATRELRMTTYATQHAATHPAWSREAQHRVDCLRGRNGPRPWHWTGIT